jgi:hypothetical protein
VTINPNLVGPVSLGGATPIAVYEPRIWKVRIWTKGGPFEGTGVFFKAPYFSCRMLHVGLRDLGGPSHRNRISRLASTKALDQGHDPAPRRP